VPEGDTLHRAAARLRTALEGRKVVRFEAPRLRGERPRSGVTIEGVEARGKNLLVHFDDRRSLRTHLRMTGSWHIYKVDERWQKAPHLARVVIEVDSGWVAVCFTAPVVETYIRGGAEPEPLARLGPDLCLAAWDVDEVLSRWKALTTADDEVGVVLMDQRIAAGIGNIYRSETLFACQLDPFTPVGEVDADLCRKLYTTASRLLRGNLTTARRTTVNAEVAGTAATAVYGRPGRGCHRCGTPVKTRRMGEQARSVYWCPKCQTRP
jgi:endonuclease VIII